MNAGVTACLCCWQPAALQHEHLQLHSEIGVCGSTSRQTAFPRLVVSWTSAIPPRHPGARATVCGMVVGSRRAARVRTTIAMEVRTVIVLPICIWWLMYLLWWSGLRTVGTPESQDPTTGDPEPQHLDDLRLYSGGARCHGDERSVRDQLDFRSTHKAVHRIREMTRSLYRAQAISCA